jgi:hypothetical protein
MHSFNLGITIFNLFVINLSWRWMLTLGCDVYTEFLAMRVAEVKENGDGDGDGDVDVC